MTEPMKGVIIMLVAFILTFFMVRSVDAKEADSVAQPVGTSEYVASTRFIVTRLDEGMNIYTDVKTGCQYMETNRGNYGRPLVPIGCFDEYKKPEAK